MNRPLLIGFGNLLAGDDGAGPRVVEACAAAMPEVDTIIVQQLTPELAEPISRSQQVVFVDAELGISAGSFRIRELVPAVESSGPLSHHFDPTTLLACVRALFGHCPPAHLVTVGGAEFGTGDKLSDTVRAALPSAIARVKKLLG